MPWSTNFSYSPDYLQNTSVKAPFGMTAVNDDEKDSKEKDEFAVSNEGTEVGHFGFNHYDSTLQIRNASSLLANMGIMKWPSHF